MSLTRLARNLCLGALAAAMPTSAVRAELVLSELIVDLQPARQARDDIEVWNNSPDRSFVAVEPREIVDPMLASQSARKDPDPEKLGLLVSPARMILEPGQRKLVRIASIAPPADREHVYRVTIKPVVGGVESEENGLKLLVGYDVLVLVRPAQPVVNVTAERKGRSLVFHNAGNISVEIVDGRQCKAEHEDCTALPGKRLYAGAQWTVELNSDLPAEFTLKSPGRADRRVF
jgi:P pilus assembly chaperone PapD